VGESRGAAKHKQRRIAGEVQLVVIEHILVSSCVSEDKYADAGPFAFPTEPYRVLRIGGAARPAQRAALAAQLHQFDILVRNDDGTVSVRWPYLKNRTVPVD
jgi:hypothetical protein